MTRRATFIDKDEKPHTIEFNDQPFTEGGEGALYHTPDKRFVVKTYHPHIGARKNLKAVQEILLAAPRPENDAYPYLAWPTGVLWDGATVGGVIMPNASYDIWMDQLIR
jgi:DNA-binding helix-hairpin-helix protein with protein kinase domain